MYYINLFYSDLARWPLRASAAAMSPGRCKGVQILIKQKISKNLDILASPVRATRPAGGLSSSSDRAAGRIHPAAGRSDDHHLGIGHRA